MVDEVKVLFKAGKGGDGVISFRKEKYIPRGGPDGGDGGDGGSVRLVSSDDLHGLANFRFKKQFAAQDGQRGGERNKSGKNGQDLVLKVPVGTVVRAAVDDKRVLFDFGKKDLEFLICKGGKGGKGNARFKSSVNTTPRIFTPGEEGESVEVVLDLELIADVGLVGFPSAGKSSLLNKITSASSKVGNYPFTTLEPVLGVMNYQDRNVVIADMPGIIEGASGGRGLGEKFLKHIQRTKAIVVVIDINNDDTKSYFDILRNELMQYSENILDKKMLVVLNKTDLVESEVVKQRVNQFKKRAISVLAVSVETGEGMEELKKAIIKLIK